METFTVLTLSATEANIIWIAFKLPNSKVMCCNTCPSGNMNYK